VEGLTVGNTSLKNLRSQAEGLTSASLALTALFDEETSRLNRLDEASRLKALRFSIRQQLNRAKSSEDAASYGHSKAKLITSLVGLGVGIAIKMTSKDERSSAFSDHLLKNLGGKERPFGTILVCIGPKGLPDDVQVVSISELAREVDREESKVIIALRENGYLLLSEEAFSRLIDRLTTDVLEGWLTLPVPTEKLAEIPTSSWVELKAEQPRWVPFSEPPQKPRPSP
jgi:hypothetical protein